MFVVISQHMKRADLLELKPDRENVTRSGTGNITLWHEGNARNVYIVKVKAGYECQPEST